MANWYYYDIFGQKQGPIDSSELKRLVSVGTITTETEIETEDGKKSVAGKVKGLGLSNIAATSPTTSPAESNTYNFDNLYSMASDTPNMVPVPPFTPPSYSPSRSSSSDTSSTSHSTQRTKQQEPEDEFSIWDYLFFNPKFTVFVTSYIISFLWRLFVVIFFITILLSVFMIGNGCRILSTIPDKVGQLERQKKNPPKEIKDLIAKKSNLLKEKEKIEKQHENSKSKRENDIKNLETKKENLLIELDSQLKQREPLLKEKEDLTKKIGTLNIIKDPKEIANLTVKRNEINHQIEIFTQQIGDITRQLNNITNSISNANLNANRDIDRQLQPINTQIEEIDNSINKFYSQIDYKISEQKESDSKLEIKANKTIYDGFRSLIAAPFGLLFIRLFFEMIFVFFRIENHLKQIEEKY
jgi:predicted  nucleic acid-binding Zn-ribbon protein